MVELLVDVSSYLLKKGNIDDGNTEPCKQSNLSENDRMCWIRLVENPVDQVTLQNTLLETL